MTCVNPGPVRPVSGAVTQNLKPRNPAEYADQSGTVRARKWPISLVFVTFPAEFRGWAVQTSLRRTGLRTESICAASTWFRVPAQLNVGADRDQQVTVRAPPGTSARLVLPSIRPPIACRC